MSDPVTCTCDCGHEFESVPAYDHRLKCGDATSVDDVNDLMGGGNVDLVFTSPPYGQQRDYETGIQDWQALMLGVFGNLPAHEKTQVLVNLGLIHRDGEVVEYWRPWIEWMREQGWRFFGWYVWDQGSGLPGDWNGRFGPSHEWIFHFNKESSRPDKWIACAEGNVAIGDRATKKRNAGGKVTSMRGKDGAVKSVSSTTRNAEKIPDSVLRISRNATIDMARNHHTATFPIELPEFVMKSWPGDMYEPFGGSGTTIIAAEKLNRRCYAMEIAPRYVDIVLLRYAKATGRDPILSETGQTFEEVAESRS